MSNISTFRNPAFGSVRAVSINNEPYFVGKDVAEILGYSNPRKAMIDHKDRMRMVLSFLEKGGFDVSTVREDFKSKTTADMSEIITETVERTGYSCEQIGKLIGVKGNTLTSYVRKDRFPRPERYQEIVMALNLL